MTKNIRLKYKKIYDKIPISGEKTVKVVINVYRMEM
jgi:hypothetical protein